MPQVALERKPHIPNSQASNLNPQPLALVYRETDCHRVRAPEASQVDAVKGI